MKDFTPALFRPSSTILIDDDPQFIEEVRYLLPSETYPQILPQEKMNDLKNSNIFFPSGRVVESTSGMSLNELCDLFQNPKDLPVSTIIMDQFMTPNNGLEIASEIKSPFVQKILISGMLKNEEAIQALNEGVIDYYLCKIEPNFLNTLKKLVRDAQRRFFCNLSLTLKKWHGTDNPLMESGASRIFTEIKENYNAPYYCGSRDFSRFSFSCTSSSENHIYAQFISKEELDEVLNSHQAESAPPEILDLIKTGKMLPCFREGFIPDGEQWSAYLQPAQNFLGKKEYYYSIFNDSGVQKNENI